MTFSTDDGMALLMLLTALDPRHAVENELTAQGKAETWAKILYPCDPAWVRGWVEWAHREPRPYALSVGDIRRAWDNHQRVEASREPQSALVPAGITGQAPPWFADMAVAAGTAAEWAHARTLTGAEWERARDALRERAAGTPVPDHVTVRRDETRERRCVNHDICVCTHTECRDGWLDEDAVNRAGGAAMRRCLVCFEAVMMRGELTPARRRTRR